MNKRHHLLAFLLLLAGFLALGWIFRASVLAYIVQPVSLLVWALLRVVLSVDQKIYWTLLVGIAFVAMIYTIKTTPEYERRLVPDDFKLPVKRVETWRSILFNTSDPKGKQMRENLIDLLVAAIVLDEHSGPNEVRQALLSGQISLPAEVRAFLYPQETAGRASPAGWREALRRYFTLHTWRWNPRAAARRQHLIEQVLIFIESFPEVKIDPSTVIRTEH